MQNHDTSIVLRTSDMLYSKNILLLLHPIGISDAKIRSKIT